MSWLRHLCEIFRFWSKNRHFWALFVFCRFFKIFEKSRFWWFGEGSTSAVWSPFELKIFWGLCLALKSSHINFQLQRTAHGGGGASAKSLIWSSKGTTCDFWPFFERPQKRHFWALLGALVCLIVLFTFFWAKPVYCSFQAIYVRSQTATFKKGSKMVQKNRKIPGICSGKKVLKRVDFGSKKLKFQKNCWKCTQRGKISWLRNLSKNFRFLSKNRLSGHKSKKCRSWPPFWKSRFRRFSYGRSSAVWCPIKLKILWGLYPTLKSSHINFQLNRTTHGGAGARPKWPFWASKGGPCDFWPFFERPPKRHLRALWGALVCLDRLVSSFWPRTCLFRNLSQSDLLTSRSSFWLRSAQEKGRQKCRFWVEKFETPNELLKMHT